MMAAVTNGATQPAPSWTSGATGRGGAGLSSGGAPAASGVERAVSAPNVGFVPLPSNAHGGWQGEVPLAGRDTFGRVDGEAPLRTRTPTPTADGSAEEEEEEAAAAAALEVEAYSASDTEDEDGVEDEDIEMFDLNGSDGAVDADEAAVARGAFRQPVRRQRRARRV